MAIIRETAVIVADAMVDFTPAEEGKPFPIVMHVRIISGSTIQAFNYT